MSGICAVWRRKNPERTARTLASVGSRLSLVPAERLEQQRDGDVGVGLSARFDTQQLYQNSRILIACDAGLYNEDELQQWNSGKEPSAGGGTTAALLARLYLRFGSDFVEKLRGAFSLVLWDRQERRLLAAIDDFGIKRLVYYQDAGVLLVASRIDALMASGDVPAEVNPRAIANVLNFSVNLGPETAFSKVQRLLPGHMLIGSDSQTRVKKYWDMRYGLDDGANEERLSQELERLVEGSVAAYCKEDSFASLGAFLSGGTDSSTVVGIMARMQRGPVKAFSIGYKEQSFNELEYAEIAAQKFKADHHIHLVGPEECVEALPHMVRFFDEPFGNSSAISTYFCARLAAENGVTFLLAGDGGDELFGGNERYATDKIFELYQGVPRFVRKGLIEPALRVLPFKNGLPGKARRYIQRSNLPSPERCLSYQFLCAHSPAEIFEKDFMEALAGYSVLEVPTRYYSQAPARTHLDRLLYLDVKVTLGDSDLPKVTQMSELAGIQTRFPFLNRSVAEFSGHIPPRLKVKGFQKRYLFKRAFRNLLPIEIIHKKKHGFGIPVATWIKSDPRMREFSRDILLSRRSFERGYFRRKFVEDLFRKHEDEDSTYYGDSLWTFLLLELWHRQFIDEPARIAV